MVSVFQIMCSKISGSCYLIMRSCYICYCEFFYSSTCTCSHGHIGLSRLQNYHVGGSSTSCVSFRTTSCMASTGIYCAALCTLRCCTLVHIHPKFIIFLWIQIITIFNHNLFVFNICVIFTNRAKQILWSRFSIDQGEFLTSIEAFLPRKQPPKIQTGL